MKITFVVFFFLYFVICLDGERSTLLNIDILTFLSQKRKKSKFIAFSGEYRINAVIHANLSIILWSKVTSISSVLVLQSKYFIYSDLMFKFLKKRKI